MPDAPAAIYQVHAPTWLRRSPQRVDLSDPAALDEALVARLVPYVRDLGFTQIELLAVDTPSELPRFAARCAAEGLMLLPRIETWPAPPVRENFADRASRFAALRNRLAADWARQVTKRLAMGAEFAQPHDGMSAAGLAWHLLADPLHEGVQRLVHDLNHTGIDSAAEVLASNPSTVALPSYRIGVAQAGRYVERIATASSHYGGGDVVWPNGVLVSEPVPWGEHAHSLVVNLPALSTSIFEGPR